MELVCDSQQQMVDQSLWVVTTNNNTNNVVILVLYQEVTNQVFPLLMLENMFLDFDVLKMFSQGSQSISVILTDLFPKLFINRTLSHILCPLEILPLWAKLDQMQRLHKLLFWE
jgi:hypothetical protein